MDEYKTSVAAKAMYVICMIGIFAGMYADSNPAIIVSAVGLMVNSATVEILEAIHNMRYSIEDK